MTNSRRVLSGVAAGVLLVATPALADWQADVQFKASGMPGQGSATEQTKGKAYGRKGLMRMDLETPAGSMSMLVDQEKKTVTNLMHAHKMMMQSDLSKAGVAIPDCKGKNFDACLTSQGYKKVGSEEANGHPCNVYERSRKLQHTGQLERVKVWHPTDLDEQLVVRSQTFDAQGKMTSQFDLTNVTVAPQPASRFTPPKDYKLMQRPNLGAGAGAGAGAGGGAAGFKASDFEGKSPEEIREMVMKRHGQGAPPQQEEQGEE